MPVKRRAAKRLTHLPEVFERLVNGDDDIEYTPDAYEHFVNVDFFGDVIFDGRRVDVDLPDDAQRRMIVLLEEWRSMHRCQI